jgi:hypothetical protein
MLYVFDTNSIRVLGNYYPERFPTFWRRFDEAVHEGRVVSVREVLNELEKQSVAPWLLQWVQAHRSSFLLPRCGGDRIHHADLFGCPTSRR